MRLDLETTMQKTHVVMLLDESGSMGPYRSAVVESFNKYVDGLKGELKRVFLSLYKFDTRPSAHGGFLRQLFENRKLKQCYPLTHTQYAPQGGTPLYDATAQLIKRTKKRLSKDAKVLFVIHTDGQENSSRKHNQETVKEMIRKCEKKRGWTFIYLGEGKDAWNAGYDFGIQNVSNYSPAYRGASMDKLSQTTAFFASNAKADVAGSHNLYGAAGIDNPDDIDAEHGFVDIKSTSEDKKDESERTS